MKRIALVLATVALVVSVVGCAGGVVAPVMMQPGLIITTATLPLSTNLQGAKVTTKRGSATAVSILGLFTLGNAGIDNAARGAGITTLSYADYRTFSIFLLFHSYTTVVYGE